MLLGLVGVACAAPAKQPWVEPARAEAPSGAAERPADAVGGSEEQARSEEAETNGTSNDRSSAIKFLEEGRALYLQGAYDGAEIALKKAVQLDPFRADARIALGKVFLIRGAAARDEVMLESARLMFEMARALDPEQREATLLLELFEGQAR